MRKSEKRLRGAARQAIYRQESIESGLRAQRADHERRRKAEEKKKAAKKAEREAASRDEAMKKMAGVKE